MHCIAVADSGMVYFLCIHMLHILRPGKAILGHKGTFHYPGRLIASHLTKEGREWAIKWWRLSQFHKSAKNWKPVESIPEKKLADECWHDRCTCRGIRVEYQYCVQ
jgi:hypothetical protein